VADGAAPVLVAAYEDRRWPASLRQEVFLFLCRMHKDTPPRMVDELYVIAEKRGRLNREERDALAYAVGDCSEEWQRFVLDRILRCRFADWTWMLSVALWRSEVPVSYVSIDHMAEVLPNSLIRSGTKSTGLAPETSGEASNRSSRCVSLSCV